MADIFVDTNRFLRFYDGSKEQIQALADIKKESAKIVLTNHVVDEFNRRRVSMLKDIRDKFDKTIVQPFHTSLLRDQPAYIDLLKARDEYFKWADAVKHTIDQMISDRTSDPVAKAFDELCKELRGKGRIYPVSKKAFKRAHRRKLLGNPPTSKVNTIGDEVHWEVLLESCEGDLVICSQDGTFADNVAFLTAEYAKKGGRVLKSVCGTFTEALNLVGEEPSPELVKEEEALEKSIRIGRIELRPATAREVFDVLVRKGMYVEEQWPAYLREWNRSKTLDQAISHMQAMQPPL
ncbi:MAG TPA: PIN domain-containing protein [Planctomycetaceae bacterium]|jgi:rRNA-processing protein FCF1|nr:PIN domain-containing protein [Planctomycetaceae bacterium]